MTTQHEEQMQYTECFVAFIDVLGFAQLVRRSVDDPALLPVLARALNAMADLPSGTKESRHQDPNGEWIERRWRVQTRAFSDTVVIFMPVESGSITQMLFMVRYLHDRMLELGLCMRGAVTIGGMYWNHAWSNDGSEQRQRDDTVLYQRGQNSDLAVTLGPGMIDAYVLESECAIYPRILLGQKLVEYVSENGVRCTPFGPYQPADRPLLDFFRTDADGLCFLDLVHPGITRNDTERIVRTEDGGRFTIRWERDGNTHETVMANLTRLINESLAQPNCPDKVRAKYEWLRTYATDGGSHNRRQEANE